MISTRMQFLPDCVHSAGFGYTRLPRRGLEFTVCPGRRQHRYSHSRGFCWNQAGIRSRWCSYIASNSSTCHWYNCCRQRHFQAAAGAVPGMDHRAGSPPAHNFSVVILLTITLHFLTLLQSQEMQRNVRRSFTKLVNLLQAYALISKGVRFFCSNQVLLKLEYVLTVLLICRCCWFCLKFLCLLYVNVCGDNAAEWQRNSHNSYIDIGPAGHQRTCCLTLWQQGCFCIATRRREASSRRSSVRVQH